MARRRPGPGPTQSGPGGTVRYSSVMADNDLLRQAIEAGAAFTQSTRRTFESFMRELIRTGQMTSEQASAQVEELVERSREATETLVAAVRKEIDDRFTQLNLVSRDELVAFFDRIGIPVPAGGTGRPATRGGPGAARPAGPAGQTAPAKKAPAKKAPASKAPATKVPAKKVPAKKATATKATATKAPAKKAPAKKATAKKATAGKATARKATAGAATPARAVKPAAATSAPAGPMSAGTGPASPPARAAARLLS